MYLGIHGADSISETALQEVKAGPRPRDGPHTGLPPSHTHTYGHGHGSRGWTLYQRQTSIDIDWNNTV